MIPDFNPFNLSRYWPNMDMLWLLKVVVTVTMGCQPGTTSKQLTLTLQEIRFSQIGPVVSTSHIGNSSHFRGIIYSYWVPKVSTSSKAYFLCLFRGSNLGCNKNNLETIKKLLIWKLITHFMEIGLSIKKTIMTMFWYNSTKRMRTAIIKRQILMSWPRLSMMTIQW